MNIGTGQGTSILEVIQIFEKQTGVKLNWQFGPRRDGDIVEIYANADKSRKLLKWQPVFSVANAIKDAWNWEQRIHQNA